MLTSGVEKNQNLQQGQKSTPQVEDSIANDVIAFKNFVRRIREKLVAKFNFQNKVLDQRVFYGLGKIPRLNFIGKFAKILVWVLVFIILALVLIRVSKNFNTDKNNNKVLVVSTPTPFVYQLEEPSIYALDEEVLKLEEEIKIFSSEIDGLEIRELELVPPSLDFDVSF